jgi:hypothetical protein
MKSLFKKHYQRQKRNSVAAKHVAVSLESKTSIAADTQLHAEADDIPSSGNNISGDSFPQIGSVNTLNDSVNSQKDDNSNILKEVFGYGDYQQMQPNSSAVEHPALSIENSENATDINGTQRNVSVSENNSSQIGCSNLLNEGAGTRTHSSSNILRYTGDCERDNIQMIKNETFSQLQVENVGSSHWKPGQDSMELNRGYVSANDVRHERHQNVATTAGCRTMPKRVRIWDGE